MSKDLLDAETTRKYFINGTQIEISPEILINGKAASAEYLLKDRDKLIYQFPDTIESLFRSLSKEECLTKIHPFSIMLDGKKLNADSFSGKLFKNGIQSAKEAKIENGDQITVSPPQSPKLEEIAESAGLKLVHSMTVYFNEKPITMQKTAAEVYRNETLLKIEDRVFEGDVLHIAKKQHSGFIFQDVFVKSDLQIPDSNKTRFTILKNGVPAGFDTPLVEGDRLAIEWT
ncbi:hypothetical protein [Metabacillus sp. RGM 3146]|uniref:hypothetical protein n=1 Tax=Metabacillus sp. RGM 3146 TaxID=3401092 RepID=UPI003B9CF2F8